jgi:uncharacterized membrane protein YphA (DoxX/SURF4 family)
MTVTRGALVSDGAAALGDAPTAPAWAVVPLRVYLGAAFLSAASNKVGTGKWGHWPEWMAGFVTTQVPQSVGLYRPILTGVILPHANLFAPLVAVAEIVVGVALILGGGTRLAAGIGLVLTLNYWMMKGAPLVAVSNDFTFVLSLLVLIATAAGRTLGLDMVLARRWPRARLW